MTNKLDSSPSSLNSSVACEGPLGGRPAFRMQVLRYCVYGTNNALGFEVSEPMGRAENRSMVGALPGWWRALVLGASWRSRLLFLILWATHIIIQQFM